MNAFAQTSARALSGSKLDNRRVLAALIDLAIVGAGGAAILVAAGVLGGDGGSLGAPLAGVVVGWALYYYFACESGGGQTLGKKLMRLRVVREDGSPAGMREIAIRTVLRVVDTALVGLIAMMATGERRARLGDLAGGTTIVSADGAPAAAAAATAAPAIEDEPEQDGEEPLEAEDDQPSSGYEPITGVAAASPGEVEDETPRIEIVTDAPAEDSAPAAEHTLDLATPSLKELAKDVAAAAGSERAAEAAPEPALEAVPEPALEAVPEPVVEVASEPALEAVPEPALEAVPEPVVELAPEPQPRPLAEVEIGGPEIDVDDPQVTVRSVDTVSAIDLVMGADGPSEDRPAADEPPAGA